MLNGPYYFNIQKWVNSCILDENIGFEFIVGVKVEPLVHVPNIK